MNDKITPDWLDRCGVHRSTRGSSTMIYQAGVVGIRFVDGELRRVQFAGYNCDVETRQDLRDLLRLMGESELVESQSQTHCT